MNEINREAWLKAVGEAEVQQNDPDALTMEQLADLFTCGRSAAEVRVKKLVKLGRAKLVRLKRQDSSGKWRIYNAYVLTEARDERRSVRR